MIKKTVTIYMAKAVPPSQGTAVGQISIGGFDFKHCNQQESPVVLKLFPSTLADNRYVLEIVSLQYGTIDPNVDGEGYFDTSISSIMLPSSVLQSIHKQIKPDYDWDTGLYTVPCNSVLWYIRVLTKEDTLMIAPDNFLVDLDLGGGKYALALEVNNSPKPEIYILGTPAARASCAVLDYDANTMSFYPHNV